MIYTPGFRMQEDEVKWFGWLAVASVGLVIAVLVRFAMGFLCLFALGVSFVIASIWHDVTPLLVTSLIVAAYTAQKWRKRNGTQE